MLSQKTEEQSPAVTNAAMDSASTNDAAAVQALIEVLQASPEFRDFNGDFGSEFLTSPMDESPWEDMLTTPALESGDNMSADILTSPAIVDTDDFGFSGMPLFADAISYGRTLDPIKTSPQGLPVQHPLFDGLYTMPSPETPSLDPSSIHASPRVPPVDTPELSPSQQLSRRKNQPTGTRKNLTPEALVPFDAPIQPRKYVTPSSTSRKEIPAVFAKKKRSRSSAFDEEDEGEDGLDVDLDAIEAKRRQNTLAARRSRKRKLEYQRELEASVEKEKEEKDQWRTKAMFYKALLESHGHEVPAI